MWVDCIYYDKGCCSEPTVIRTILYYPECHPRICDKRVPFAVILRKEGQDEIETKELD